MKKTLLTILILILTVMLGVKVANAIGSLTTSGTVGDATHYTLNDIYTKLTTNNSTSTKSGLFSTPGSVAATFYTLTDIYNAIPTIDATKVASGTTYLGVNGTFQITPPDTLIWESNPISAPLCQNNYVHTGCTEGSGLLNGEGAVGYCANLVTEGSSDWRLPTIEDFLSITNFTIASGSTFITEVPGFLSGLYWSGTVGPQQSAAENGWTWSSTAGTLSRGSTLSNGRFVRCVRTE